MKGKSIAAKLKEKGKSRNKPDSAYDPEQLAMGTKVEMEHGLGKDAAKEIAKDHLEEMPDYYTKLAKMEAQKSLNKSEEDVKEATKHSNKLGAGAKKRKKLSNKKDKFHAVMSEFKRGTLHSSSGELVTDRQQALAIAASEAGITKKSLEDAPLSLITSALSLDAEDIKALYQLQKAKGGAAKQPRQKDYAKVKGGKKKNPKAEANAKENAKFAKEQRKAAGYDEDEDVEKSRTILFIKGRKPFPVGTIKNWKGINYVKTAQGWKPKAKGNQKEAKGKGTDAPESFKAATAVAYINARHYGNVKEAKAAYADIVKMIGSKEAANKFLMKYGDPDKRGEYENVRDKWIGEAIEENYGSEIIDKILTGEVKPTSDERQIARKEELIEEAEPIKSDIGGAYRIAEGSGLGSGKTVKIIKDFDWHEEAGAYRAPDKDWVAVQFENGEKRYFPADRLFKTEHETKNIKKEKKTNDENLDEGKRGDSYIHFRDKSVAEQNKEEFNKTLKELKSRQGGGIEYYEVRGNETVEYDPGENKFFHSKDLGGYRKHSLTGKIPLTDKEENELYRDVGLGIAAIYIVTAHTQKSERVWHGKENIAVDEAKRSKMIQDKGE